MLHWQVCDHTDIYLFLNNMINVRPLTTHIMCRVTPVKFGNRTVIIDDATSLHPMYNQRRRGTNSESLMNIDPVPF